MLGYRELGMPRSGSMTITQVEAMNDIHLVKEYQQFIHAFC